MDSFYLVLSESSLTLDPDAPLTPEELALARKLAKKLAEKLSGELSKGRLSEGRLKVRLLLTSSRLRAIQLADTIHDELNVKMKALGALAGQARGAESDLRFRERISDFFRELLLLREPALLVTHPDVVNVLSQEMGLDPMGGVARAVYSFEKAGSRWSVREIIR